MKCFLFHIYLSNLNFDVAIKPIPIMPIVILAGNGRMSKNIKTAPVSAKTIPTINITKFIVLLPIKKLRK